MQGICQNLGITRLYTSSNALTEKLRSGETDGIDTLLNQVSDDYRLTAETIQKLNAEYPEKKY